MLNVRCRRFGVLAVCLVALFTTPVVFAQTLYDFNLPAQALADSLRAIGQQTSVNILFDPKSVEKLTAPAVRGQFSASQAVNRVLTGTNLAAEQTEANTLLVEPKDKRAQIAGVDPPNSTKEGGKNASQDFRVAQVDQGTTPGASTALSSEKDLDSKNALSEIVVTAQKRSERLQDVPVPVTVLSAQSLVQNNELRIQDYYTSVPGLSYTSASGGTSNLALRGVTTGGGTNPTVGITVDGVPYGSSSALANAEFNVPDIDPSDLQRIEVLRGPQGTLYGASTIGGLIQYVTVDPSTDGLTGRVEAGTSSVYNGTELGYNTRAAVNVPLGETIAIRANAFTREDPGYIDDPDNKREGVNKTTVSGGRVAFLWRPSSAFSVKLTALDQETYGGGNSYTNVQPGLGILQQSFLPGAGAFTGSARLFTSSITAKIGTFDIAAITGYGTNKLTQLYDATSYYGPYTGIGTAAGAGFYTTRKFTQELRLSSTIGPHVDWMLGGFYTHEVSPTDQTFTSAAAAVESDGRLEGSPFVDYNFPSTFAEVAIFSDVTFHIANQFDVQVGARESENHQIYSEIDSGPGIPILTGYESPLINPKIHTKDSAFTYLVTPSFKFGPDEMIYSRIATGYRPGGPNPDATIYGFPAHYDADKTTNYEIGVKADVLEHRLSVDASIYYIDWKDIQVQVIQPVSYFAFYTNASSAKSQGIELSAEMKPVAGLKVGGWVAWNEAKLTAPFPDGSGSVGVSGDRLPYGSRISASSSIDDEFQLAGKWFGFGGGSLNYIGERYGEFVSVFAAPGTARPIYPGYAVANLHAGVRDSAWTLTAFCNNVADRRGVTYIDPNQVQGYVYIQPRTVGLTVSRTF